MQLHNRLVSLLAVLYVLEPALAVAIVRTQAYLSLDPSLTPGRRSLDARMTGLRFFRRRAPAALVDDWNDVNDQKPDAAHVSKRTRSLITLHPISTEGDKGESHIIIGKHKHRRAFHRSMLRTRQSSAQVSDVTSFGIQGVAGTIDIMVNTMNSSQTGRLTTLPQSPTADSPVGERIASLSVSTESSEQNQFVLNASGVNASTVYLVVKSDVPMKDGSLTVALQVPVFDQARASYVAYCATFDTTQASPLAAVECVNNAQDVTDHSSQLFSYNSTSGVIKPLWLTSASPPDMETPASAKEEDDTADQQELPEESDPTNPTSDSSTAPQPQSVSLVFTPDLDSSTPVVKFSVEVGDGPNASDPSSSTSSMSSQSVSGMAMNTYAPSHTPTISMATAEAASSSTIAPTLCTDSVMMQMPSPSVVAGDSMQPPRNDEVSPMMDEPSSSMTAESNFTSTVSSTESALPTETTAARRRDIVDDDEPEVGDDGDQDTDPNETSNIGISNDEAKREVDTAYVWKFNSAPAVGDDGDFVQ